MSELDQRMTKLEHKFHYFLLGVAAFAAALIIYGGPTWLQLPKHAAEKALEFVRSDDFNAEIRAQLNQLPQDLVLHTGTVMPDQWKLVDSGGMYGIHADVAINLSELRWWRIFLSTRGESIIWETQGLSAYPLREWYQTDQEWAHGFRVVLHGGNRADDKDILDYAKSHRQWHVDWMVIGAVADDK